MVSYFNFNPIYGLISIHICISCSINASIINGGLYCILLLCANVCMCQLIQYTVPAMSTFYSKVTAHEVLAEAKRRLVV